MSDTPRADAFMARMQGVSAPYVANDNWHDFAGQLERELRAEQEHSMMAGSQLSALRLQLRDAEERASRWAKIADQRAIEVADLKHRLGSS